MFSIKVQTLAGLLVLYIWNKLSLGVRPFILDFQRHAVSGCWFLNKVWSKLEIGIISVLSKWTLKPDNFPNFSNRY